MNRRCLCMLIFASTILIWNCGAYAFDGNFGFTAVFAFSTSTGRHGWGFNITPEFAAQRALLECGPGAQIVAFQKDGYLALVWDDNKFAYGYSKDSGQEAYDNAQTSFQNIHGSTPRGKKVVSSDGRILGFN